MRTHDPGHAALRRAGRAALLMPAMFALGDKVIANPIVATFAAFGSFAMLLLVDYSGPIKNRVRDQAALGLSCAVLICLGTLASRTTWLAAVGMAVVAFVVLFSGVLSSVLAGATTALLLAFILPVSLPGSAASIPDRVAGWGLAAGVSLLAISLLWPSPPRDPVRAAAISAARALAERLRADVAYMKGNGRPAAETAHRDAITRASEAVQTMQTLFYSTPYRPAGLGTEARAAVRVIDELRWLDSIVLRSAPGHDRGRPQPEVWVVKLAAADVLASAAQLLENPGHPSAGLEAAVARMRAALHDLERATVTVLPAGAQASSAGAHSAPEVISSLDPGFRAQELSFVAAQIATNAEAAAAASRRSWMDRLLGRQPREGGGALSAVRVRAGSHFARESLWLRNSLRGGAALGLAVLVADLSGVQHGFWVAFGTLSVLRSNALSTGQNIVRALAGTAVGFLVGGVLVYLIGTNTTLLWVLLPIAVLLAGLAPATISFAAGQAAFTLTLLILFNLIAPAGWKIGLIRVEDVALGGAVSLAVGLLFWPRGAAPALARTLAQSYTQTAQYLADTVAYGVGCCDPSGPTPAAPREQALAALAASLRLDDSFRGYLAERGSKPAPLADVTALVMGVTGIRLASDAVLDLWHQDGAADGDRTTARRELTQAGATITDWYHRFAASLRRDADVPAPIPSDPLADARLIATVAHDLAGADGRATATGVRVIWTGDHLDAVRRLQQTLVGPARAALSGEERGPLARMLAHAARDSSAHRA